VDRLASSRGDEIASADRRVCFADAQRNARNIRIDSTRDNDDVTISRCLHRGKIVRAGNAGQRWGERGRGENHVVNGARKEKNRDARSAGVAYAGLKMRFR